MKKIILVLMLGFFPVLFAQSTYACSCAAAPTPRQALREAKAVFIGEVISTEVFDVKDEFGTQQVIRVRFAVSRFWKGVEGAEIIVHTSGHEMSCGFHFEKEKKYLVYAYPDHWKLGVLETGICSRTRELAQAAKDLRVIGQGNKT
jgi:hypothetical protein